MGRVVSRVSVYVSIYTILVESIVLEWTHGMLCCVKCSDGDDYAGGG